MEPRINRKIVKMFLDLGRELFPLCRDEEYGEELPIKLQGKKPLHKNWRSRTYDFPALVEYVAEGHNLGWKIGPSDMVIDIDPRNGGREGYKQLLKDFGVDDLGDLAPTVHTGGGGTHYYFKIPNDAPDKLRKKSGRYEGVDFQREGAYVVIPGSWHYEAENLYSLDDLSPFDLPSPALPDFLVDALSYGGESSGQDYEASDADLTPEELRAVLDQIPVEEYDSNDPWLEMLFASHYATKGAGLDVFLNWSLGDPNYADDDELIRIRWDSVGNDTDNPVTTATLYRHLRTHGGEPPNKVDALAEFGEYLESGDEIQEAKDRATSKTPASVREAVDLLDEDSNSRQINDVLKHCLELNAVQIDLVLRGIAKNTKVSKLALKEQLSELRLLQKKKEPNKEIDLDDADLRDLVQQVTAVLLREKYDKGRRLKFLDDGRFWFYDGRKWKQYFGGLIERDIYEAILAIRVEAPEVDFDAARVMHPVERILRAKTASEARIYDPSRGRPPVINLHNCELWIDSKTGALKKRKHSPESGLTYCLDIDLDTDATCPIFDQTLREIFVNERDPDNIIRHLWEIFGYLIQPNKNIASWFLFMGSGANGKSLILEVLSALLGDAVLEQSISDFAPGRNYTRSELVGKLAVIDDDVSARTILPDEFMKKVSENKTIVAEQKYGPSIRFRSTAAVVLSANSMPGTRDLSYGMLRRAMLVPFRRRFERHERDYNRARTIIDNELPGVLVSALKGLKRLRKRGDFKIPRVCSDLRDTWRDDSNPVLGFIADCFERGGDRTRTSGSEVWSMYEYWALENGVSSKYKLSKRNLFKALVDLGFEKYRGAKGNVCFRGLFTTVDVEEAEE